MTPGETSRAIESRNRIAMIEAKEKALYDYIQAKLIVKGISITLGSKESFPQLHEVYPEIFCDVIKAQTEKIEQKKMELSTLRFKQFAQSYNNKFKK